jgi:hypothetical protein
VRLFGLPKDASYFYGTFRDDEHRMWRILRGVGDTESSFRFLFREGSGTALEVDQAATDSLYLGPVKTTRSGPDASFVASGAGPKFSYQHRPDSVSWSESGTLEVQGRLVAPAIQWFNPWPVGGCYSVTAKYRARGTLLHRPVEGFVGHEVHYMPPGVDWMKSPYGKGREICWQQIANEYEDGTIEQATFAFGTDGWGFAMVHDSEGRFFSSTDVQMDAEVRPSGWPESIRYRFDDQSWVWRIDPKGERGLTILGAPLGADGTCTRENETRRVSYSMGNSDWWTDGRADAFTRPVADAEK